MHLWCIRGAFVVHLWCVPLFPAVLEAVYGFWPFRARHSKKAPRKKRGCAEGCVWGAFVVLLGCFRGAFRPFPSPPVPALPLPPVHTPSPPEGRGRCQCRGDGEEKGAARREPSRSAAGGGVLRTPRLQCLPAGPGKVECMRVGGAVFCAWSDSIPWYSSCALLGALVHSPQPKHALRRRRPGCGRHSSWWQRAAPAA